MKPMRAPAKMNPLRDVSVARAVVWTGEPTKDEIVCFRKAQRVVYLPHESVEAVSGRSSWLNHD